MKTAVLSFLLCVSSVNVFAEEVKLQQISVNKGHFQIPVDVDVTDRVVNILVRSAFRGSVVVTGPEGIVFQQEINALTAQYLKISLRPYMQGDYTITFYDSDGNIVEGEFFLGK